VVAECGGGVGGARSSCSRVKRTSGSYERVEGAERHHRRASPSVARHSQPPFCRCAETLRVATSALLW